MVKNLEETEGSGYSSSQGATGGAGPSRQGHYGVASGRFRPECIMRGIQDKGPSRMATAKDFDDEDNYFGAESNDETSLMDEDMDYRKIDLRWSKVDVLQTLNVFNPDALEYLQSLSECVYKHQDVCYHMESFIQEEVDSDPDSYYTTDDAQLKDNLSYLVFTDEVAKAAVECVPKEILLTQGADYWAMNYLENWIMCDPEEPFPHRKECIDRWFEDSIQVNRGGVRREIPVYRYNRQDRTGRVTNDFLQEVQKDRVSYAYYYHGTEWKSADNIVHKRILISQGAQRKDFSDGDGFYISDDFEKCIHWAQRKNCPAIIVFKVPIRLLEEDKTRHLNIEAGAALAQIYRYFRSGRSQEQLAVYEKIRNAHTITGPILDNPEPFMKGEPASHGVTQTCIRNQEFALQFSNFIHGVIYYERRPNEERRRRARRTERP